MNTKPLFITTLIGGVLTVVANYLLLMVGKPFTHVPDTFMTLSAGPVIAWSIFGTIGACITFFLTRKFADNPNRTFIRISAVVLVLSFIPDVLIHGKDSGPFVGVTWSAVILLMLMHVAAAAILVYTLTKYTKPKAI
jgi:predicted ferric reductase